MKCGICGYVDIVGTLKLGDKCPECGNTEYWIITEKMFWNEMKKKMRNG